MSWLLTGITTNMDASVTMPTMRTMWRGRLTSSFYDLEAQVVKRMIHHVAYSEVANIVGTCTPWFQSEKSETYLRPVTALPPTNRLW